MIQQMIRGLTKRQAKAVEIAYNQALTYVWGRQDGDGSTEARDTDRSEQFAEAFALHVRAFVTEQHFVKLNLQSAFDRWNRTGTITLG